MREQHNMAATASLYDRCDGIVIDGAKWDAYGDGKGGSVGESGGVAVLTPASSVAGSYASFDTLNTYDLTGSYLFVNLKQALTTNANTITYLGVQINGSNYLRFSVYGATPTLHCYKNVAGAGDVEIATVAYNATNHAWLKIRESGGTVYFDYSSDGVNWNNLGSVANPFNIFALKARLSVFADNVASPGAAWFANFNVKPRLFGISSNLRPRIFGPGLAR